MGGKRNKRLPSLVWAGIVVLVAVGCVNQAKAESHRNYFPLNVGNSWTYVDCNDGSTKTFTIIGTEKINGHTYYKFDDYFKVGTGPGLTIGSEGLFRYDPDVDVVLRHTGGEDIIRYKFAYGGWVMAGQWCRLRQAGVACSVPAGEFSDCFNFQFVGYDCGPDCYGYGEYLAPDVGLVKYVIPGGTCLCTEPQEGDIVTFELQSYTICGDPNHPYPVGDLNQDCRVDMVDFAVFAAHWLECTAPEPGVQVTDVKIFRCELVGEWFEKVEEVDVVKVGDVFTVVVEVTNFGSETEHVFNLYNWDMSPENCVEVIGSSIPCATYYDIEPGDSASLWPFCSSQAFEGEECGSVTMNIYVRDWIGVRLCEYTFRFEVQ